MSNLPKKIILTLVASFYLLVSSFALPLTALAQEPELTPAPAGTWYNQNFFTWWDKVYGTGTPPSEIFGERYTAAQVQWVVYGLIALIFNMTGQSDVIACVMGNAADLSACASAIEKIFTPSDDQNVPGAPPQNQGPVQSILPVNDNQNKSLLSMIFDSNRPISAISYTKQKLNKFDLIPVAEAQAPGFGFSALAPIQDMWRGARDIAFGFFVITAVIFAFMIMFRVKINPQTVITVQSAIPKVIGALIAVTFSYAIAGLLIDLMYVVIGILSIVFTSFVPDAIRGALGTGGNWILTPPGIFNTLTVGQPFGRLQVTILGFLGMVTLPFWVALIILTVVLIVAGGIPAVGIWFWLLFIPIIVVCILIHWLSIKTIWALFKAFANIILLTVFGPLQIALGALIPNFGLSTWIKSYISHLSVFVVTGALGFMSIVFTIMGIVTGFQATPGIGVQMLGMGILGSAILRLIGLNGNIPDAGLGIATSPWPPLLGTGNGIWIGLLFLGVAFVLFTMIPKATELVQSFLAGKPFAYGSAIGEAIGPLAWGWDRTGGSIMRGVQREREEILGRHYLPIINSLLRKITPKSVSNSKWWPPTSI